MRSVVYFSVLLPVGRCVYNLLEAGQKENANGHCYRKRKECSKRPSLPLPDGSTTRSRPSLTSLFEWEAVTLGDVAALEDLSEYRYMNPLLMSHR